jgi:hypothetical protein
MPGASQRLPEPVVPMALKIPWGVTKFDENSVIFG